MSEPQDIPVSPHRVQNASSPVVASPGRLHGFLIPSPVPTRRQRTYSASERARAGPSHKGHVKTFCRNKGHGFITPEDGSDPLFVHISDIEGEFVPKEGDYVAYKTCHIPPKMEKQQAVHVQIVHPAEGVIHETWDQKDLSTSPSSR